MYIVGRANKLSQYVCFADTDYEIKGKLGERSSTLDSDGIIIERKEFHVTQTDLENACKTFIGTNQQVSGPKRKRGPSQTGLDSNVEEAEWMKNPIPSEERPFKSHVNDIEILNFDPPNFHLKVNCSGTFIPQRFVDDLGNRLETLAHTTQVVRTKFGPFTVNDCLVKHQLYWPAMKEKMKKSEFALEAHLKEFFDLKPFVKERRF